MLVPEFLPSDIRPAMLGARARVSGEKLNNIIREINRRNSIKIHNHQIVENSGLPAGALLSQRGEVLLRGEQIISTKSAPALVGPLPKLKEFLPGEEITYQRLNEILREVNRLNGCPPPDTIYRPSNTSDCADVELLDFCLTKVDKPETNFKNKLGPLENITDDVTVDIPDRIYFKYPEPIDSYDELYTWKSNNYKLLRGSISALEMDNNSGVMSGYGQAIQLQIAFVTHTWNSKELNHNNAPDILEFTYIPGSGICAGPFQPPNFGKSQSFPGKNFKDRNLINCEYAPDFSRKYGVNTYFIGTGSTRTRIILDSTTITPKLYEGNIVLIHQGFDDGTAYRIKFNDANSFMFDPPLDFDPTPGDYIEYFPKFYGFFLYLFYNSFGGSNNGVSCTVKDLTRKTYRIENDV